jgi:hypothetical protein
MLSGIMMSAIMLSGIMLSDIMLSGVAQKVTAPSKIDIFCRQRFQFKTLNGFEGNYKEIVLFIFSSSI